MDLHALITGDDVGAVAQALADGADVDARNPSDDTPLYAAMRKRSLAMVELLLANGADPNAIQENRSRWDKDQAWIQRLEKDGKDTSDQRAQALNVASPRTVFSAAVALWGNVELVQRLLDAGARVDVTDPRGWTPLHFAAAGRAHSDVLQLLVSAGADLHARCQDGRTALALCCREWRSSETECLLRLGAPMGDISWSELHLGALRDHLPSPRDPTIELEALDIYGRTALHIAFALRNQNAIHELLDVGANPRTPHPTEGPLLRMALLFAKGALLDRLVPLVDVNERWGSSGTTALMESVDHAGHVRRLLDAGADPTLQNRHGETAFQQEYHGRMATLQMLRPGSDWSPLDAEARATLLGNPDRELVAPSDHTHRWRVYGDRNPTDMSNDWWLALFDTRAAAYLANDAFADELEGDAVWSADRFGQSLTRLDDGRFVEIGGEHEDWYDQNFCIYNDVIVYYPDGTVRIFGYPPDVFPPTDNHSATWVGDYIYVVGNVGYGRQRKEGFTPVYRLRLDTWQMEDVECTGAGPGWISKHEAALVDGCLHIWGGRLVGEESRDNEHSYSLDLSSRVWRRLE